MHSEYYETLIHKHLSRQITTAEQEALDRWLEQSPENRRLFEASSRAWALTASFDAEMDIDLEAEKARFRERVAQSQIHTDKHTQSQAPIRPIHRLYKFAAAAAIVVAGVLAWLTMTGERGAQIVYQTAANETRHFFLPDSSTVWLNANSKLAHDADFDVRTLELEGEAFFDVTHNPDRPFVIHTSPARVQVLGTSFNIKNYADETEVQVTVATGLVAVQSAIEPSGDAVGEQQTRVAAGRRAVLDKATGVLQQQPNNMPDALAWRPSSLVFDDTPFTMVVSVISRHFALPIATPDEGLQSCTFTGQFENPTFSEVQETLAFSLNLSLDIEQGEYVFRGTGCSSTNP